MNTLAEIPHFQFEEDFIEDNVRCIPMIVRFKLDACGIKLKLAEWCRMDTTERQALAQLPCKTVEETDAYRNYLKTIIYQRTGNEATELPLLESPAWDRTDEVPFPLLEKLREFNWTLSLQRWKMLNDLQRFALLKLSYPSHENKNFPKAMREFLLVSEEVRPVNSH
jgi:hypothetical protein